MATNPTPNEKPAATPATPPAATPPVATPPASTAADTIAEQYVDNELKRARTALLRTQTVGAVLVLFVVGYLSYVTFNFHENLQPAAAAAAAHVIISDRVHEQGPELVDQIKEKVPEMIAQLPDYAIKQLPQYREKLENQFEADFRKQCEDTSASLDSAMDKYLTEHKDKVKALLETGQDPQAVDQISQDLEKEMMTALKTQPMGDNETAGYKIAESLRALQEIQKKMQHLANDRNLTPQEQKTRRAIAILTATINKHVDENRGIIDNASDVVKNATDSAKDAVDKAAANAKNIAMTPPQ